MVLKVIGGLEVKIIFIRTQMLFSFFTLSLEYNGVLQNLHVLCYCNRMNAEADLKVQESSLKPDIKGICKNINNATFLLIFFLGGGFGR